ncbi:MAG: NAD(+) synthase [Candidatus Eremiobacteraeota bacterium]|nr:NAD(+) synthase [Candidatus Eremiobacteraeota bacterium]
MNLKVAAAVLNQTPLDWEGNVKRLESVLEQARAEQVDVLCCPELCLSGYGCEDAFHSPDTASMSWRMLERLLPLTEGLVVNFGLPVWYGGAVYNAVVLAVDGRPVGLVAKQHLAGDGIHYEPRWFKSWPAGVQVSWESPAGPLPLGDQTFDFQHDGRPLRVGFEICEDAWVADRPGGRLAGLAVDLILNPSASHFAFGKQRIRERFVVEGSRAFSLAYVYANLNGNEAGRAIYDGGALIASGGEIVARGRRLTLHEWGLTTAVVDIDRNQVTRARTTSFRPKFDELRQHAVKVEHHFGSHPVPALEASPPEDWEEGPCSKEEEFSRAVSLGLLDYMRKSRSRGFILSLSGGADSAACAVLIHLMHERLRNELDTKALEEKLSYWPEFDGSLASVLTTVYQSTRNSGEVTRSAAASVANSIGANHVEFDVDELVLGYRRRTEQALGRELTWERDDIALQNIQARVRAPGPWMLANVLGALFISTSNRSEAAVGYATMDGDTSGGLAPIAGIDKAFLRRWLRWMESDGPQGYGSLPSLSAINVQAPTAELRPQEASQTDEDDLMPYPVLERIERLAIRDKVGPEGIYDRLRAYFPESGPEQRLLWVERFFRLFTRNQWKRERYAPSFHLDDQNLDPKTWCRFPILSGGFALELKELRAKVGD